MKNEIRRKLAFFLCFVMTLTMCMIPVGPKTEAEAGTTRKTPYIETYGGYLTIMRYSADSTFSIDIKNANPKAEYTISFSNPDVAELVGSEVYMKNEEKNTSGIELSFFCWAKKAGTTKFTVKQTLKGKTTIVPASSIKSKYKKVLSKDSNGRQYYKYVATSSTMVDKKYGKLKIENYKEIDKNKADEWHLSFMKEGYGIGSTPEVIGINSIQLSDDGITAEVKLARPLSEMQISRIGNDEHFAYLGGYFRYFHKDNKDYVIKLIAKEANVGDTTLTLTCTNEDFADQRYFYDDDEKVLSNEIKSGMTLYWDGFDLTKGKIYILSHKVE